MFQRFVVLSSSYPALIAIKKFSVFQLFFPNFQLICEWIIFGNSFKIMGINKDPKWTELISVVFNALMLLKACIRYSLSNFYFFIKWQPFRNYEKWFWFNLKGSFHSWDIQIVVLFPLPFQTFQIQKGEEKWDNLWCHELACINLWK